MDTNAMTIGLSLFYAVIAMLAFIQAVGVACALVIYFWRRKSWESWTYRFLPRCGGEQDCGKTQRPFQPGP